MINYKQTIYAAGDRTTKSNMVFTPGDVRAYILKLDFLGLSTEAVSYTHLGRNCEGGRRHFKSVCAWHCQTCA